MGHTWKQLLHMEKFLWKFTFISYPVVAFAAVISVALHQNRAEPFGVCFRDHPRYDENLCPKDELKRWQLLQEDTAYYEQKWSDLDCKCPQQKEGETPLEKWERVYCNKGCFEDGAEFSGEIGDPFLPCKISNPDYSRETCAKEVEKYDHKKICNPPDSEKCKNDPLLNWRKEQEKISQDKLDEISKESKISRCGCSINEYDQIIGPLNILQLYKECEILCEISLREKEVSDDSYP